MLVFVVERMPSKMSIIFGAGESNMGERSRRAGHTVTTRLVASVGDVNCTCFFAPFTHVFSSHCPSKFCDHVIKSFDIIVEHIKCFGGVYLPFKHDVIAFQSVVDNYLIFPIVFPETDYFGDPRTVRQIYASRLEWRLDHVTYLPAFRIRLIIWSLSTLAIAISRA